MKSWEGSSYAIDLDALRSAGETEKLKALEKDIKKEFIKNHPFLDGIEAFSEGVSTAIEVCDSMEDAVNLLLNFAKLVEMSDGAKTVLQEMANRCPDSKVVLKQALNECAAAMQSATSAITIASASSLSGLTANTLGEGLKDVIANAAKSTPYTAAFLAGAKIGDKIGTGICNLLFSTDKFIEQYIKMCYLEDFMACLHQTVWALQLRYVGDPSSQNADAYIAFVNALHTASMLSCDFATSYASILYEKTVLNWSSQNQGTLAEFKRSVAFIRECYRDN